MSSEPNQFFDVAKLRILDLTKAAFQGEEIIVVDDKEVSATSFLTQCLQMGIVDEATLKSGLTMYLATTDTAARPPSEDDGSLARWQDDGGAPVRVHKLTRLWLNDKPVRRRSGRYRFPVANLRNLHWKRDN